jgi:hypothetical protein
LAGLVVSPTLSAVQNFRTIGQRVCSGVPENGMFLQESEAILNTVLSANALARDVKFDVGIHTRYRLT